MRISVIVPCYNCAPVVGDCLSSILSQGHEDVEVVCVNDGSTDDTLAVLRDSAEQDRRVVVLSQENGGVSSARNAGLRACTGDVVLFVDADDALVEGSLTSIAVRFAYGGVDCLVFGMLIEPPEAAPLTLSHRLAPRDLVLEDRPRELIFHEHTHPYAFRVAFDRAFLIDNGLTFDEALTLGEDEAFLMCAYRLAHRVILSSEQLYVYRMSETSASHRDNASDDVLSQKLDKHLDLVRSVFGAWRRRGFDGSCDQELLDWCLDLLMLDVSRLEPSAQVEFYGRLWQVLQLYFGSDGGRSLASTFAKPCLRAIQRAAYGAKVRGPVVPLPLLATFYLSRRGISAVTERAFARLRGMGAYR